MASHSIVITVDLSGNWVCLLSLFILSLILWRLHSLVSSLARLESDHTVEHRIHRPIEDTDRLEFDRRNDRTIEDSELYSVDEEFPWSEAEYYALWSEFYQGMDEDSLMNLENLLDR